MGVSEQSFRDDSDSGDFCGDNYEDAVLSPRGLLHADQDFFASDYFNCLSALLTDTKNEHGRSPMDPQCCSDLIRPIRKKKKDGEPLAHSESACYRKPWFTTIEGGHHMYG